MDLREASGLTHLSRAELLVGAPARVFAILEDPALAADLYPAFLQARLVAGPWMMREGERVKLELTFWGVAFPWHLAVEDYERGERFVHRMVKGPLRSFSHRHLVQPAEGGQTRVVDLVSYDVGYGLLGRAFDRVVLKRDLEQALVHRNRRLAQMLGGD